MTEAQKEPSFEELVEWAYGTLPQNVKDLPDFPGIQIVEEPPAEMLESMSKKRNWPKGTELRGCYSGFPRTQRRFNLVRTAPELIFVFRGPILRCSRGNLAALVKQTVWHEVAHWLGHDENEIKELGLSLGAEEIARDPVVVKLPESSPQDRPAGINDKEDSTEDQPRCIKCYSPRVTCREMDKPTYGSRVLQVHPIYLRRRICTCESCGHQWDDEDDE